VGLGLAWPKRGEGTGRGVVHQTPVDGEASYGQKRVEERSGLAPTSCRASVLRGIWRQEITVLLSQREEGEKVCTNDEWAPQEFSFSDLTNTDSDFWLRKNI
jgi:hypothetical protein